MHSPWYCSVKYSATKHLAKILCRKYSIQQNFESMTYSRSKISGGKIFTVQLRVAKLSSMPKQNSIYEYYISLYFLVSVNLPLIVNYQLCAIFSISHRATSYWSCHCKRRNRKISHYPTYKYEWLFLFHSACL